MSNEQITLREGVTEPQDILLVSVDRETNAATPIDLTGASLLEMRIRPKDRVEADAFGYDTTDEPNNLAFPADRTTGLITFTPTGAEFDADEHFYECYFRLTDADGNIIDIPSDGTIPIEVLPAF